MWCFENRFGPGLGGLCMIGVLFVGSLHDEPPHWALCWRNAPAQHPIRTGEIRDTRSFLGTRPAGNLQLCPAETAATLRASHAEDAEDRALPCISRCQHIPSTSRYTHPFCEWALYMCRCRQRKDACCDTADVEASTRRQTLQLAAAAAAAACMPGSVVAPQAALAAGALSRLLIACYGCWDKLCASAVTKCQLACVISKCVTCVPACTLPMRQQWTCG